MVSARREDRAAAGGIALQHEVPRVLLLGPRGGVAKGPAAEVLRRRPSRVSRSAPGWTVSRAGGRTAWACGPFGPFGPSRDLSHNCRPGRPLLPTPHSFVGELLCDQVRGSTAKGFIRSTWRKPCPYHGPGAPVIRGRPARRSETSSPPGGRTRAPAPPPRKGPRRGPGDGAPRSSRPTASAPPEHTSLQCRDTCHRL